MSDVRPAPPDERAIGNSYQMFLSVAPSGDIIDRVTSQLGIWLREKGWEAPLDTSAFQVDGDRDLLTLHLTSPHEFRARLTERTTTGTWRTQLTVQDPTSGTPWIALQVASAEGRWTSVPRLARYLLDTLDTKDGSTALSSTPRVIGSGKVGALIDEICDPDRHGLLFVAGSGHDGYTEFDLYKRDVAAWTKEVRGLAQVVVLTPDATDDLWLELGPDHGVREWTLRTFYPRVDPAVRADALRHKFMTSRRLDGQGAKATAAMLGGIARRHAAVRRLPTAYIQADRTLRRLEDQLLVDSITLHVPVPLQDQPASAVPDTAVEGVSARPEAETGTALLPRADPTPVIVPDTVEDLLPQPQGPTGTAHGEPAATRAEIADAILPAEDASAVGLPETVTVGPISPATADEIAGLIALTDMAKEALGISELTREALLHVAEQARRAQAVTRAIDRLKSQLDERELLLIEAQDDAAINKGLYEDLQLEERETFQLAAELADQNRYLKERLIAAKDFEAASGHVPEDAKTSYPNNFDELHQRLAGLSASGVIFTGKADKILELDAQDTLGKLAATTWEALLVLADYVRARNAGACDTGVSGYLEKTPDPYRTFPPNKFAERESEATMAQFGHLRVFSVPKSVDPAGRKAMEAHFKIGRVGMISPRMHILDCWATHRKVFVGYIGAHLRNTQTN